LAASLNLADGLTIELRDPDLYRHRYTIMVGGEPELHFILRNDRGRELKGIGAVDYILEGSITTQEMDLVSAMTDYIVSIFAGTVSEYVALTANELGTGTLTVTALTLGFYNDLSVLQAKRPAFAPASNILVRYCANSILIRRDMFGAEFFSSNHLWSDPFWETHRCSLDDFK